MSGVSLPPLLDRPARVLVVASEASAAGLARALEDDGHQVYVADVAAGLVERALQVRADLVLLDTTALGEGVLESVADLRMVDDARLVPVVLATGSTPDEEEVVRGLMAGADDVCARDRILELLARVRAQLRNRRDRDLLRTAERERVQLHDAARTDPLTGLGNRRAADDHLARAFEGTSSLLLMVIDVDRFKSINDRFGHARGDDVLRALGASLRRMAREGDRLARYGGEEFLAVLRDAPPDRHQAIAERFLGGIRSLQIPALGGERITASIGAATWTPADGSIPPAELFRIADEALYEAKGSGRDRVVHRRTVLVSRGAA